MPGVRPLQLPRLVPDGICCPEGASALACASAEIPREVIMVAKRARWPAPDIERLIPDLQSPDDAARGEAVRALCPCHAGWEAFEGHVAEVLRAIRDRSRGVRAHALHVFEDAARMQHAEEFEYDIQEAEEMVRRKRASRFRPEESGLETMRREKIRRRRRRR